MSIIKTCARTNINQQKQVIVKNIDTDKFVSYACEILLNA